MRPKKSFGQPKRALKPLRRTQTPLKPYGRSLKDFLPLKPGEQKLLDACRVGEPAVLSEGIPWQYPLLAPFKNLGPILKPYKEAKIPITDQNTVRAGFLRFLLLGGDDLVVVHEHGVFLIGAYIEGELEMRSCCIPKSAMFRSCFFPNLINLQDASVSGLIGLNGCYLADYFRADRLKSFGGFFFRDGSTAIKAFRLLGAEIQGDFNCEGSYFLSTEENSIIADRLKVKGNVNFGKGFVAKSSIRLPSAEIGRNLYCDYGKFANEKDAIFLQAAHIKNGFFFRNLISPAHVVASHLCVGILLDDERSWADGCLLDGFCYEAIGGASPVSGALRVKWILKQYGKNLEKEKFRPQPWYQLQNVLIEMGHTEDAKFVGIAYQENIRKFDRVGQSTKGINRIAAWWRHLISRSFHRAFGVFSGYGYRPMRLVTWMLGVWIGSAVIYGVLADKPFNAIAPSDPLIFQNHTYSQCRHSHLVSKEDSESLGNWVSCKILPGEYPTFSEYAYSLDLLLPVVDLGLEKTWGAYIPSVNEGETRIPWLDLPWGYAVRLIAWIQIIFGWISSLMIVATITGFSRRNEEK